MQKIIRQYYLLSALFNSGGLQIISATYVAYLLNHNLSLFEINMVNAAFFTTLFICEIPTGAFADSFGRKNSFLMACLLLCVSMFIYIETASYVERHAFAGSVSIDSRSCLSSVEFLK